MRDTVIVIAVLLALFSVAALIFLSFQAFDNTQHATLTAVQRSRVTEPTPPVEDDGWQPGWNWGYSMSSGTFSYGYQFAPGFNF